MARTDLQINIRIPHDLKDRLDAASASASRSLTAEVVQRLEQSLRLDEIAATPSSELADQLVVLLKQAEELVKQIANQRQG